MPKQVQPQDKKVQQGVSIKYVLDATQKGFVDLNSYIDSLTLSITKKDNAIAEVTKALQEANAELDRIKSQVKEPNVQIEVKDGQMRFTVLSEVLFDSGKAELKNDGIATLDSIITVIQKEYPDREIAIEGHTDTDPIKASKWNNNRDLSYARSLAVLSHAQEKGIAPEQLKAVACGEFFPVAPNDSAKNKSLNRRAVIVVMPPKSSIILDKK